MPYFPAAAAHKTVQPVDNSLLITLSEYHTFTFVYDKLLGRVVRDDHAGTSENSQFHHRRTVQHQMIDLNHRVAEGKPDTDPEDTAGDTTVVRGAAVDTGEANSVTAHFGSIKFSVDTHLITQRRGTVKIVQEKIIDCQQFTLRRNSAKFRQFRFFQFT